MKILITGACWMLGRALVATLSERHEIFATTRENFDITDVTMMTDFLRDKNIDVIINAAAFTNVRVAEMMGESFDNENFRVNALGVQNLAKLANEKNIFLIHISTDYIFDGEKTGEYLPSDTVNPKNFYGKAKEKGESYILENCKNFCIIRTAWLYDEDFSWNHLSAKIWKKLVNNEQISMIDDVFSRPTFSLDLAVAIWKIIEKIPDFPYKIVHFTNSGDKVTPHDIAIVIADFMDKNHLVTAVNESKFSDIVSRPKNSLLKNETEIILPDWKQTLKNILNQQKIP